MQPTPQLERQVILAKDHRRKYGAKVVFQVAHARHIADLENVTLLEKSGQLIKITPSPSSDLGNTKQYSISIVGFPRATDAEKAGIQIGQALLLSSLSLNFGLRLVYSTQEPAEVFDRTKSGGMFSGASMHTYWPQDIFLDQFDRAFTMPESDPKLLLSMELFASSQLESNDRTRFVMAVSALEPLGETRKFGSDVSAVVDKLCAEFDKSEVPQDIRNSLRSRLAQLKTESIAQGLRRLCDTWFPGDADAKKAIERAYRLRSELVHEGRLLDRDILLDSEFHKIGSYIRQIYEKICGFEFRASTK